MAWLENNHYSPIQGGKFKNKNNVIGCLEAGKSILSPNMAKPEEQTSADMVKAASESAWFGEEVRKKAEVNRLRFDPASPRETVKHLIYIYQADTNEAEALANRCRQYYNDKLSGYTIHMVASAAAAVELLGKYDDWSKLNTIIGGSFSAGDIGRLPGWNNDKAKLLPLKKADSPGNENVRWQPVPTKEIIDLMAALARVNKPLGECGSEGQEMLQGIRELLRMIRVKNIDDFVKGIETGVFMDPLAFAKNYILELLPPAGKVDKNAADEVRRASRAVVEAL